jgi:hypothetical protein
VPEHAGDCAQVETADDGQLTMTIVRYGHPAMTTKQRALEVAMLGRVSPRGALYR